MKKLLFKFLILEGAFLALAYVLRIMVGSGYFLSDAANWGWVFGVIGTVYTLIAAFVLFGVWNQYNALSALMAREAWLLASLWNFTDYFNDEKLSNGMRAVLLAYIRAATDTEVAMLAENKEVETYSREYKDIGAQIDEITFDDGRDSVVYPLMIQGYRDLLDVRQSRNEAGVTRLSESMKILFTVFSLLLAGSILLLGFSHMAMYLVSVAFIGAVVILTYMVVADMDNPFGGLFELQPIAFHQAKEYIAKTEHKK